MTHRTIALMALLAIIGLDSAAEARQPPRQADPAYLATIVDDEPYPLPRGLAPWERAVVPDFARLGNAPPQGPVRAQAEYELTRGIFIRWGSFNALHTAMTVPLTTASPPATVWIAVSGTSQENAARSVLLGSGADLDHVEFVHGNTDSVWIRDYGPRFIDDNGALAISDHIYNRPRPNDDAFPSLVAAAWNMQLYELGLVHGGGNFHLFRNRDAFMTRLIANENPGVSENEIVDRYLAHQGLNVTLTDPFPQSFDSTQHIDMWMLPLADNKIVIGEYAANQGGGTPRQVTEATTALLEQRGYKVLRTPGWGSGGTHYTYTNSVIVNQTVLVCQFNGYSEQNATAISAYESALPSHDIVPIDCSDIIGLAGAIHCIVKHVPELVVFRDTFDGN